jgi:hypothetical protein
VLEHDKAGNVGAGCGLHEGIIEGGDGG